MGENYVTIPFKKKGAEADAKNGRREMRFGPPPTPFLKEACTLFSRMCLSFAADVLICYFCLFALLFFSFVFSEKEKAQTLLKLFE